LLLDQVLPLVLSSLGYLTLHASAVVARGQGVAFVGGTGAGKSTLAGSFSSAGFPILSDDCLVLERRGQILVASPAYPGLRLWPDVLGALGVGSGSTPVAHYTRKMRFAPGSSGLTYCAECVPLRQIYILSAEDADAVSGVVTTSLLSAREAFIELFKYTFRLDVRDRERLRQDLDRLTAVAASGVRRLAFARDLARLAAVRQAVLEDLARA
jgi:hypothetical protein